MPGIMITAATHVFVTDSDDPLCSSSYNFGPGNTAIEDSDISLSCYITNSIITQHSLLTWMKNGHNITSEWSNKLNFSYNTSANDNGANFSCILQNSLLKTNWTCKISITIDRPYKQNIHSTGDLNGTIVEQNVTFNQSDGHNQPEIQCVAINCKNQSHRLPSQPKELFIPYGPMAINSRGERNLKTRDGENATFLCHINSFPVASIKWYQANGTRITSKEYVIEEQLHGTVKTSALYILGVSSYDYGNFSCKAENELGIIILNFCLVRQDLKYTDSDVVNLGAKIVTPLLAIGLVIVCTIVAKYLLEHCGGTDCSVPIPMLRKRRKQTECSENSHGRHRMNTDVFLELGEERRISFIGNEGEPLFADDVWEIPSETLHFYENNLLGEGAFGEVRKAFAVNIRGNIGKIDVAVKMLRDDASAEEVRQFKRELQTMKSLPRHPNIVALLGCCTEANGREGPLFIITELMANGSLLTYLRDGRGSHEYSNLHEKHKELTPLKLLHFSWQIARGMSFLESEKCLHRDLAARNVLLGEYDTCKISDFGLAKDVKENYTYQRMSDGPLPLRWMAVESLRDSVHTTKSDVWSFGVLLWEIVTLGASPYPALTGKEVKRDVCGGLRLVKPRHCDDELFDVMMKCWKESPTDRPSFSSLCKIIGEMKHNKTKSYLTMSEFEHHSYINNPQRDCEVRGKI
ncbi:fibroblast growth factor receptor 2-like [Ptychodera flava]|uniref:fibroblast growth factor receptor 2-like n=1 Tax=Ptychodera flava TaxID=63121 RepID=UPI00396A3BD0